jgi:hypothetical protein
LVVGTKLGTVGTLIPAEEGHAITSPWQELSPTQNHALAEARGQKGGRVGFGEVVGRPKYFAGFLDHANDSRLGLVYFGISQSR